MKSFQVSKDSSFRMLAPIPRMEMEEETVQATPLMNHKTIYRPIKIVYPLPSNTNLFGQKKTCNCKKSQCLKQYCDCFANGQVCSSDCNCVGCFNNTFNQTVREHAQVQIKNRDPGAFKQAFKGCNCKKSGCQKKYCECFLSNLQCTHLCRCDGCLNCSK